jgi:TfoX/Sxy family transcriptional regulator of competence genes
MSGPPTTPEEHYATIVDVLLGEADVTFGSSGRKGFGSSTLWVSGKIFAMLVNGKLVAKVPRKRVDALIASGAGERFDPGHGRLMKEWVAVEPTSVESWLPLAREAKEFVSSKH